MARLHPVVLVAALGLGFAAVPARGAAATACSTKGVAAVGYRVVRLSAAGVSCDKARSVAALVARQLRHQGGVSVPGVAGFSMSTRMCTGCRTTTDISLSYGSGGKVSLSIEKRGATGTLPAPTPPRSQSSGPVTV